MLPMCVVKDSDVDGCQPSDGISKHRTYRTRDLMAILPGDARGLVRDLQEFFGLLPLGRKEHVFDGLDIIDALKRQARNEMVEVAPPPLTRDELRVARRSRSS